MRNALTPSTPLDMASSKPIGDVKNADLDLVSRIRSGDGSAFEELYRQHSTRLYNLAYRMTGGPSEAEDLLQDIFLLVHRKVGSFRGDSSLGTWLYRLAMNHCLDVLRSRQTRMGQQTDSLDDEGAAEVANGPFDLHGKQAIGAVNRMDLERAIDTLPPACRAAFLLHDVEGFGHEEVGSILGISEGTSKSQVHKARLRIRQYLMQ